MPIQQHESSLARELIYFAGHGYNGANASRYPLLLALPQVEGRLPVSATVAEVSRHIDNVLIDAIQQLQTPEYLAFAERLAPPEEMRRYLTQIMGLPPFYRAKELERHREQLASELHVGSVATWRRRGGPEEELVAVLARQLLRPPGARLGGRWIVRRSGLTYTYSDDPATYVLKCVYEGETVVDGATSFGVDHRSTVAGKAATFNMLPDSTAGCDDVTTSRLADGALSIDLLFTKPLPRGSRRVMRYALDVETRAEALQVVRLNSSVSVWRHDLEIAFTGTAQPARIWWFANHIGVGAGEEPAVGDFDVNLVDGVAAKSFAGLREGPDYGIAWRWR